jgi:hypothetical protein
MSAITDILNKVPLDDLADKLGVTKTEAKSGASEVISSLLGGMQKNSSEADGEQSLAKALLSHLADGEAQEKADKVDLAGIDLSDGAKIVKNIFGGGEEDQADEVAKKTGLSLDSVKSMLPVLAPLVLNYLANKSSKSTKKDDEDDGLLDNLLDSVTGNSGGIGGLLGGLLGGGSSKSSGGLSDLIGKIL